MEPMSTTAGTAARSVGNRVPVQPQPMSILNGKNAKASLVGEKSRKTILRKLFLHQNWSGGPSQRLQGFNANSVLGMILLVDLVVGRSLLTFANTSKPQYSRFVAFVIPPIHKGKPQAECPVGRDINYFSEPF